MGSLRGGYYYCHHFSFQSGMPARSAPAAPFLQSQSSSLQVKNGLNGMHLPGPNFPAGFQVPLSAPQGSRHAPAPLSGGYLAACRAHSFPFQYRPRNWRPSAQPAHLALLVYFRLPDPRLLPGFFPSLPPLSTPMPGEGSRESVWSRACGSSVDSSMGLSGFLVQLHGNKGWGEENRVFHSSTELLLGLRGQCSNTSDEVYLPLGVQFLRVSQKLWLECRSHKAAPKVCQTSSRTTWLQGGWTRGTESYVFLQLNFAEGWCALPSSGTPRKLLLCVAAIQRPLGKNSFFIYCLVKYSIYQTILRSSKDKMEVKPKRKIKALMQSCRLLLHFIVNWVR